MRSMGSDLYLGKVEHDALVHLPLHELAAQYTDGEFLEYLCEIGADEGLEQEPSPQSFVELASEALKERVDEVVQSQGYFFRGSAMTQFALERPKDLDPTHVDRGLRTAFVAHNLLASVSPQFTALPVRRIQVTLVTVHPDAGYREPDAMNGWLLRAFALRTLGEAHVDGFFQDPFSEYFAQFGEEAMASSDFCGREDDVDSFVWGVRYLSRIPMRVDDPAFWDAHAKEWWSDLRERFTAPSDHLPYEVATLEIDTHPSWPGSLTDSVFESRAY